MQSITQDPPAAATDERPVYTNSNVAVEPTRDTHICRFCGEDKPLSGFFQNKAGLYYLASRCRKCLADYREDLKARKAAAAGKPEPGAPVPSRQQVPVRIERRAKGSKFSYVGILPDGTERVVTGTSGRTYEAASVYRRVRVGENEGDLDREVGDVLVFLHSRSDLAAKGSPDANLIVKAGDWERIPGVVEVVAA